MLPRLRWHLTRIALFGGIWFVLQLAIGPWWAWGVIWAPILGLAVIVVIMRVREAIAARRAQKLAERLWKAPDPWRS